MGRRLPIAMLALVALTSELARAQRIEFPTQAPTSPPLLSPASSYGSAIQPPPPTFDPYAMPSTAPAMSPPSLAPAYGAPYDPTPTSVYPAGVPVNGPTFEPITNTWQKTMRFLQVVDVDETWLARGGGQHAMGSNTINTWATFALPFYSMPNPILITPGFQLNLWDGPEDNSVPNPPNIPGQTYGAYIDAAWNPRVTNWFGGELEISPGIYTDFQHTNSDSIRILGRGLGVLTLTPTMQLKLGIWYLDRNKIKLLPAGGVVWTPNPDARYEIFFPAPKLAHRCRTYGNHTLWAYIRGEYGGGAWTIERANFGPDDFDYNDIRIAIGVDVLPETQTGLRGYLEVGYAFERELVFRSNQPGSFNLSDTVLVGGGLAF